MTRQRLSVSSVAAVMVPVALCLLGAAPLVQAQGASYASSPDLSVTPRNGQSAEQQAADSRECQGWAHAHTGFDADSASGGVAPGDYGARRAQYARAMAACLEAHGYTVRYTPPAAWTPPAQAYAPAPPPPPGYGGPYVYHHASTPTIQWSPVHVHADAGYTAAAGDANTYLDDGWNAGVGVSLFPVESIPVGLRLDGSYSRFEASDALLNATNASFGHQSNYGGDVDLQFNFPAVWNTQFYLFGGVGWYREQTVLHQASLFDGGCDFFYGCGPYAAVTGTERYTTSWHDAWNAGAGWEFALADRLSLFVEVSYLRIRPDSDGNEFVPLRVGVRF